MSAFQSPSYLQLEGIAAQGDVLAVSCSALGGNEWHGELRLFGNSEAATLETVGAVRLDYGSSCCKVYGNGTMVSCGTDAGDVLVFKTSSIASGSGPSVKLCEHDDVISAIDMNEQGTALASASWDRTVKIWDLTTGRATETIALGEHVAGVSFVGPNVLACGERDGSISLWDSRKGMVTRKALDHGVTSLISSKSEFVIIGCADGSVIEWTPAGDALQVLRKHNAAVHALAVCPESERLLSGSDDGVVFQVGRIHQDFVRGAGWWRGRPVTSSWDGTMRFADMDESSPMIS